MTIDPHRRGARLGALAIYVHVVFLPTLGCSWVLVNKPPPGPIQATPPIDCQSSSSAPGLDTLGAVLFALGGTILTIGGLTAQTAETPPCEGTGTVRLCSSPEAKGAMIVGGVAAIGAAVALGFSAGDGNAATDECARLKEAQVSCTSGVEEACRTLRERK